MTLVRQHHEPSLGTAALQRRKEALALDGECARVVVILAMDEEQRLLDFLGGQEAGLR